MKVPWRSGCAHFQLGILGGVVKSENTLRMTPQREVLLQALRESASHPTADELYEKVRRKLPRVSLGTVYRNLEILSERGMIRKIEHSGAQMRFDGDLSDHGHIRCVRCGRLDDLPGRDLPGLDEMLRASFKSEAAKSGTGSLDRRCEAADEGSAGGRGYEIIGRRIEFFGVCPECKTAGGRSGSD
jgi:Fe2+ or Zn2+ uptake regulation protein